MDDRSFWMESIHEEWEDWDVDQPEDEKCNGCGSLIDEHEYCPKCDY